MKTLLCSLLMTLLLASFAAAQCSYSASFTLSGAGGTALTRRTVQDCFDAVPFSSTRRDNVVGALQQMTSLYFVHRHRYVLVLQWCLQSWRQPAERAVDGLQYVVLQRL